MGSKGCPSWLGSPQLTPALTLANSEKAGIREVIPMDTLGRLGECRCCGACGKKGEQVGEDIERRAGKWEALG